MAEKEDIREIRDTVNMLNGEVSELSKRIGDLRDHTDKRIDDLNGHLKIYFTIICMLMSGLLIPIFLRVFGII